ncbi:MAG: beta-propeller domain-containing protein, partial [Actinomycetes bacterium]|nr:beta-propeller domain-containing protein [Actinomycetes bacterium]
MNFSKRYKQEMDAVRPDEAQVEALVAQAREATAAADAAGGGRTPRQRRWLRIGYAVGGLSLTAVAMGVVVMTALRVPSLPPLTKLDSTGLVAAGDGYGQVYERIMAIRERNEALDRRSEVEMAFDGLSETPRMITQSITDASEAGAPEMTGMAETAAGTGDADSAAAPSDSFGSDEVAPTVGPDYSDTTIQVSGVQEGDIVKTDGSYIYALGKGTLRVIAANAGHSEVVNSFETAANEFYLSDGRVVLLTDATAQAHVKTGAIFESEESEAARLPRRDTEDASDEALSTRAGADEKPQVRVEVYDCSNPTLATLVRSYDVMGTRISSRMIDNILYVASSYYLDDDRAPVRNEPETFLPFVVEDDETILPAVDAVHILPDVEDTHYAVVAGIDIAGDTKLVSQVSVLGGSNEIYSSLDNLYLLNSSWNAQGTNVSTRITRIGLDHGWVKVGQARKVEGSVKDRFSLDENDGVLRVVSHSENGKGTTAVTTLEVAGMKVLGKLDGIAKGEELKSVRYIGDYAYFVTFVQTDPLFAVDLSRPSRPRIVGELKLPGFSEYMQPWSDNRLLGLGWEADEETGVTDELKISMFNVSDPANLREEDTLIIK